jgi:hypothetical protein
MHSFLTITLFPIIAVAQLTDVIMKKDNKLHTQFTLLPALFKNKLTIAAATADCLIFFFLLNTGFTIKNK